MRRGLFLLPVLLAAVLFLFFRAALRDDYDPHAVPSPLVDQPMPRFDLAGPEARLSGETFAGEVALVNFFASWCVPCRAEHPLLMRLAAEQHVPIYGIALKDKPENAARFISQMGNPYRRIGLDENGRVGIEFGITGVPETFVIDKSGHIRRHYGAPLTAEELKNDLEPLLRELARS
jgi:cytochrome c biogenesis protein CcmG/thiol:disulfide interchange protein DsbE